MSLIKEFKELHIGFKVLFFSWLFQIPFFFIAIYLFKKPLIASIDNTGFISDLDFYFVIALCSVFSLTWLFINLILTALSLLYIENVKSLKKDEEEHSEENDSTNHDDDSDNMTLFLTTIYSIGYLSLMMILNYYFKFTFNKFLLFSYLFIVVRILWILIWNGIISLIKKKTEKVENV